MSRGLPQKVKDNLEKCRVSALAAVEAYNRPGPRFRTAQYLIMIVIAWTALFHALFYRDNVKPWYRKKGKQVRYVKIDGEPKHWDLHECLSRYFGSTNPPERKNLEFLIGLRNKIEHRHLPELDATLYGECQAALLNLEELLVAEFGQKFALAEQLAVSLQFSRTIPSEKRKAARVLASASAKSVKEYVEKFRGKISPTVLNSIKYSFNVFLVPKVANRKSASDLAVEFVRVDEASEEELERMKKLNVLIREKHIPIANLDMYKPGKVVAELRASVPYLVSLNAHSDAWKYFQVRPLNGSKCPEKTDSRYCVYDAPHADYLYTQAWIEKLKNTFSNAEKFEQVTGRKPKIKPNRVRAGN